VFFSPENLASAFRKLHDYHNWRKNRLNAGFGTVPAMSDAQQKIADDLRSVGRTTLTEYEGKRVLAAWGVATTEEQCVSSVEEAAAAEVSVGTEVIVGVTQDHQLGPVLLYRMGGIFAEVVTDVALRICPISRQDAQEMVDEVAGSRILSGLNGQPRRDVNSLINTLVRVSDLAVNLEGIVDEIDINSMIVLPQGQGVKALDVLITLLHKQ
jgi:succinyl-CoA synthetase beta subunit